MTPLQKSEALLAAAPFVGRFVGKLFGVEAELERFRESVRSRDPIWRFRKDFAKKRVLRADAAKAWTLGPTVARDAAKAALQAMTGAPIGGTTDEEATIAAATLPLLEVDEVARKAAKAGGAQWTDELRARARRVRDAVAPFMAAAPAPLVGGTAAAAPLAGTTAVALAGETEEASLGRAVAFALDSLEAWLASRLRDAHDPLRRWVTMRVPKSLDYAHLVEFERPDARVPELFVGPHHERRQRLGFSLTDTRMSAREVEQELDYCMLCHDREKDSCSHGLPDPKSGGDRKNPLGVALAGCPLEEKISEMHAMRQAGELVAALAIITVDNPMCPGTGHRICNDCMKACIFQKQEPVNIPQAETRVLTETLDLPWGLEIYQFLDALEPAERRASGDEGV